MGDIDCYRGVRVIPARWSIATVAALALFWGISGVAAPVSVDAGKPLVCAEVIAQPSPDPTSVSQCQEATSARKAWAWPAVLVGGVVLLGCGVIRRWPDLDELVRLDRADASRKGAAEEGTRDSARRP
jgi:hypothetical protein